MNGFRYIILLVITLMVLSCEKKILTYQIDGIISDQFSAEVIDNISVKLYQKEYRNGVLSDNYTFVGEDITNANGKYEFEINRVKIYEIKIEIEDAKYYFKSKSYSSSLLTTGSVNTFNESIESKSWVSIFLKNSYVAPNEQMNLYKSRFKEGCSDCCTNGNSTFFETGDTTIVCAAVGGAEVILNYGIVGGNAQFNKTITCIPFDTTFFTITY